MRPSRSTLITTAILASATAVVCAVVVVQVDRRIQRRSEVIREKKEAALREKLFRESIDAPVLNPSMVVAAMRSALRGERFIPEEVAP